MWPSKVQELFEPPWDHSNNFNTVKAFTKSFRLQKDMWKVSFLREKVSLYHKFFNYRNDPFMNSSRPAHYRKLY